MLCCDMQRRILHHLGLLVNILSLSDQDAGNVLVSRLARPPHVIERLLARIALAHVEGQLILCRANLAQHVVVSLPLEQRVADTRVPIVGGVVQWSPLSVILSVDVGS